MNEWQGLANAIVEQAAKDYKAAQRTLKKDSQNQKAKRTTRQVERFFHSSWYEMLTDVDPEYLLACITRKDGAE